MKKLTVLSLDAEDGITDAGLYELAGLTNLTNFAPGSKKVTGLGLKVLSDAKGLKQLYTNCPKFSDAGLKEVAAFKGLTLFQLFNGSPGSPRPA